MSLSHNEERFRRFFELGFPGMAITSPTRGVLEVNDRLCEILGYQREELLRATWADLSHPDDITADMTQFDRVLAGEIDGYTLDKRWVRKDGEVIDSSISVRCVRRGDGSVEYFLAVLQDITEHIRAARALRDGEARFRALAEHVPSLVWTSTADRQCDYVNPQLLHYTGLPEQSLLGGWRWDLAHPDDREGMEMAWRRSVDESALLDIEVRLRRHDGAWRWFQVRAVPLYDERGRIVKWFGTNTDIDDRKRAEEALRVANARLGLAVRSSNIGTWEVDMPDGVFLRGHLVSMNFWEQLGYDSAESPSEVLTSMAVVHPDDLERTNHAVAAYLAGDTPEYEVENRMLDRSGAYRWMLTRGVAVRDAGGKPIRLVGTVQDTTDRKRGEEELRRAKEAAEAANLAKSTFLGVMSHELRTPLNAILGYAQLMDMGLDGPVTTAQHHSLARITRAQEHLLSLIDDILQFGKLDAGQVRLETTDVSLAECCLRLDALLGPQIAAKRLRYSCNLSGPAGLGTAMLFARADPHRLLQILVNLVTNAVKYTPDGGAVAVDVAADSSRVAVGVRDTGCGIPSSRLGDIFEPFVQVLSVDRKRDGVGLGLAISRNLARAMGGDVTVASTVGEGSTFTLTLPRGGGSEITSTHEYTGVCD
jgi:PAS domain S-box-containing protein